MVAHAIRTKSNRRGPRPFEPARDLAAVARLLEEAFRPEHTFPLSNTPILRELGIILWTLSYAPVFPENVTGYVWVEDGRVVGNTTISRDESRLDRYLISNVAVKPSYRRQGIARALMQVVIEHLRGRGAKWLLLNVRPSNADAVNLYRALGFQEVEMRGEWTASPPSPSLPLPPLLNRSSGSGEGEGGWGVRGEVRALRFSDRAAVTELIRAATPSNVHQFRSPRLAEFDPQWEDLFGELVSDFIVGQVTHRRVLEREGRLAAVMLVRGQRWLSPHRIAIQVHPDYRGRAENDLVAFALSDLARFPRREIRAAGASTHPELIAALEQHGFKFLNGLMLMALGL
ncbi:MAG: GNAT family N-acetyltransferase [Chloroflexi bacterium]|nr:GNAT family N-acetyltransferase [Chloroflexota bacterium]